MFDAHYVHLVHGRLRIKVADVKRSPHKASRVEEALRNLSGVTHVKANPTTGNVLVLFQPNVVTHDVIIGRLRNVAPLCAESPAVSHQKIDVGSILVRSIAELLVERAIVALL
jgi:copper chaperone CopZ